jgi:hypothetical protein
VSIIHRTHVKVNRNRHEELRFVILFGHMLGGCVKARPEIYRAGLMVSVSNANLEPRSILRRITAIYIHGSASARSMV